MASIDKIRLLQGAAALLYLGPLLAGLGGYGWPVVPVFAAIFVLWIMILRPQLWPRELALWADPLVWTSALSRVLIQVLLVAVCFGVGRGLGGIMGYLPLFHPMLPIAISFLSIPLSRLIWDPWANETAGPEQDLTLHNTGPHIGGALAAIDPVAPAEASVDTMLALPGDCPPESLLAQLHALLDHPEAWARLDALVIALDRVTPDRTALRAAVISWATDPEVVAAGRLHNTVDTAFQVAGRDVAMLRLMLPRAQRLIAAFPDRHHAFPSPFDLTEAISEGQPADIALALAALATAVDQATPPELREAPGIGEAAAGRSALFGETVGFA